MSILFILWNYLIHWNMYLIPTLDTFFILLLLHWRYSVVTYGVTLHFVVVSDDLVCGEHLSVDIFCDDAVTWWYSWWEYGTEWWWYVLRYDACSWRLFVSDDDTWPCWYIDGRQYYHEILLWRLTVLDSLQWWLDDCLFFWTPHSTLCIVCHSLFCVIRYIVDPVLRPLLMRYYYCSTIVLVTLTDASDAICCCLPSCSR